MYSILSQKSPSLLLILCSFYLTVITSTIISIPSSIIYAQDKNDTHPPAIRTNSSLPLISPNPVGKAGNITLTANYTDDDGGITSVIWKIKGPNIGSSDPNLAPVTIGSSLLSLIAGTNKDGTWVGTFTFPDNLPDGNYLYSLTAIDASDNKATIGLLSGIILNRLPPDATQTKILSVVDDSGRSISNGSTTSSLYNNVTFTFEGIDESGVILEFQCNLDDMQIIAEHQHGEQMDVISTCSPCFTPTSIAQQIVGSHSYTNLLSGNHTFKVRAVDNEYNIDSSPSVFKWTIR